MKAGDKNLSSALKTDVGRQMFSSVPYLLLFVSQIMLIQGLIFIFRSHSINDLTPAFISFSFAAVCIPLFLYLWKNSQFSSFTLLNFLFLFVFFCIEMFLLIVWKQSFIHLLLLLILVLTGYYLLSNGFYYTLLALNSGSYCYYVFTFLPERARTDALMALATSLFLSFLFQRDRRKTMIRLSGSYDNLKEVSERFRQLEENISQIFILSSSDFSEFFYISSAFEVLLPLKRREFLESPDSWRKYIHSGDRLRVELEVETARKDCISRDFDFRYNVESGTIWLRFQLFPIESELTGKVERFAIIIDNVTESKNAELKLAEAKSLDGEMAARIQKNLLFSRSDLDIDQLDAAADSTPSLEVGGDYFDLYRYSDKIVDVIIADVMGKGMVASLLGAASKSAFMKSRLDLTVEKGCLPPINEIVEKANGTISNELMKMGKFITLQYARLDLERKLFYFVDKGHTSILHYSARMKCCWSLKGWNMPIGFKPDEKEVVGTVPFESGDLLFLYSDGIIEAVNGEGELFGEKRLAYVIKNNIQLSARRLIYQVRNLIFHYSSSQGFADDVTAIAIKIGNLTEEWNWERSIFEGMRESLKTVRTYTSDFLKEKFPAISQEEHDLVVLAVNEAFANVVEHDYEKNPLLSGREILIEAAERDSVCFFRLFWDGVEFDWSTVKAPAVEEMKSGGYGLTLMRGIMDSVSYSSNMDGVQQLCMMKKISSI